MKTLYFDCFAGASGDMILGALAALGVDRNELIEQLQTLDFTGWEIDFETVDRSGLSATKAHVRIPQEHAHRHLSHIVKIIEESGLTATVKRRAIEIFTNLGKAEAKMHNVSIERVHFHEVGAMDAILDIVGACVGFELLGIENFVCSKLHVGSGMVKMAHGKFPVPPPAVAELLRDAPVYSTEIAGELVTPTGAAIIATLCDEFGAIPEMKIERVGYGAGTREYKDFPNVLRLMLGDTANGGRRMASEEKRFANDGIEIAELCLLETNVDDLSSEILGFVMERAFAAGALDCWFDAIQMKKNRPATKISILCAPPEREKFMRILFEETSTLGVRVSNVERHCLPREIETVETEFGAIDIKFARLNGKIVKSAAEYEHLRRAAVNANVPLREVEAAARQAFETNQKRGG